MRESGASASTMVAAEWTRSEEQACRMRRSESSPVTFAERSHLQVLEV